MPTLGAPELIIILVIVIVLFGAGRLAEIGGSLGKGIKEFRKATRDEEDTNKSSAKTEETHEPKKE